MTTETTRHTPGPWTADFRNVLTREGLIVAICIREGTQDPNRSRNSAEANARLIAAAPEMAEELWEAVGWWHAQPRNFTKIEPGWLPAARALLRRIEGK